MKTESHRVQCNRSSVQSLAQTEGASLEHAAKGILFLGSLRTQLQLELLELHTHLAALRIDLGGGHQICPRRRWPLSEAGSSSSAASHALMAAGRSASLR